MSYVLFVPVSGEKNISQTQKLLKLLKELLGLKRSNAKFQIIRIQNASVFANYKRDYGISGVPSLLVRNGDQGFTEISHDFGEKIENDLMSATIGQQQPKMDDENIRRQKILAHPEELYREEINRAISERDQDEEPFEVPIKKKETINEEVKPKPSQTPASNSRPKPSFVFPTEEEDNLPTPIRDAEIHVSNIDYTGDNYLFEDLLKSEAFSKGE